MDAEQIEWSPTDAIGEAWEKVKADPVGLVLPVFVVAVIHGVPNGVFGAVAGALEQNDAPGLGSAVRLVSGIVGLLISAFMTGGMMTFLFKVARGQAYELGDIFSGGRYFPSMLLTLFLMQIGTGIGFLLCLIPGIVLALGWFFAVPLVVDRDLPAIDALKESWRITTGHKMNLFVFGLIAAVIGFAGVLACCVGIFPAAAVIALAQVFIYERLADSPQSPAPTVF